MRILHSLLAILLISLAFFACKKDKNAILPCPNCPYISGIEPDTALSGDTILLVGEKFGADSANNEVKINNLRCTVLDTFISDTTLLIIVPANCSSGYVKITTNKESVLTNADQWVQDNKGALPYFSIRDTTNGPLDTGIHISDVPIISGLDLADTNGYLVDSFFLYIDKDYYLKKVDLRKNVSSRVSNVIDFRTFCFNALPHSISQNCYVDGNEVHFIYTFYNDAMEMTYYKSSNTADSTFLYSKNKSGGYQEFVATDFDLNGNIYFTTQGLSTGIYASKIVFNKVSFHTNYNYGTPNSVVSKSNLSLPYQYARIDENNISTINSINSSYAITKVNTTTGALTNLGITSGNYPIYLNQKASFTQSRMGKGTFSSYKNKILFCDKDNGIIRELDFNSKTAKNIYASSDLEDFRFFIKYFAGTNFGILIKKNSFTHKYDVYSFKYN